MLLLERVREIGADEAQISDDSVTAARRALTREMARSARPERVRRRGRTWAGIGLGGVVAGAAVTAIVAGSVLAPAATPDAQAAEVLETAARVTVNAVDTTLAPGQYLRIEEQNEWLQFWSAEWAEDGDENTFAFNSGRDGADAAVLVREPRVLYVPADRTADWFYDWGAKDLIRSFGERGAQASSDWASSPELHGVREGGTIERLPGGEFLAADGDPSPQPYLADPYRPHYAEMPRDPEKLLEWLRESSGMTGVEADRWIVAGLSGPSAINLMPADLRSAFFRAIALIPGFDVQSQDGDLVTLEYAVPGHRTTTIVIDTVEGLVESISESFGSGGVAGDTPESLTRVRMTVVDSAP